MVAHQDRGVVAPPRVGRRPPAAERGLVDHVVVDEGRGVEQLHHAAHANRAGAPVAGQSGRDQEQDRPKPLAPRPRDELPHLVDQGDRRLDLAPDGGLDRAELAAHGQGDAILEQRFERGGRFHEGGGGPPVTGAPPGP